MTAIDMPARPPRRRQALGQHHLRSGSLCRPLLDFLGPARGLVIEIGPGGGVLTAELLARGHRVAGWELDIAWAAWLRGRHSGRELPLVIGDALSLPWEALPPGSAVVGNLPYAVATALIARTLAAWPRVERAAFLVQREVAERLTAPPSSSARGALSVLVQARSEVQMLGTVPASAFRPPPKVTSAFVGLELRPPPLPHGEMVDFDRLVRLAFAQRRKTLRNTLGSGLGRAVAGSLLSRAALDGGRRAEELTLDEFLALDAARRAADATIPLSCAALPP